jgi:hypothetical protein
MRRLAGFAASSSWPISFCAVATKIRPPPEVPTPRTACRMQALKPTERLQCLFERPVFKRGNQERRGGSTTLADPPRIRPLPFQGVRPVDRRTRSAAPHGDFVLSYAVSSAGGCSSPPPGAGGGPACAAAPPPTSPAPPTAPAWLE